MRSRSADGAHPSVGEVLGCTAPVVGSDTEAIVFVADGRFHLEAFMIANPSIPAFRRAALLLSPRVTWSSRFVSRRAAYKLCTIAAAAQRLASHLPHQYCDGVRCAAATMDA